MLHLEGQETGFSSSGTGDGFVIGSTDREMIDLPNLAFPVGSYIRVKGRYGRIIGLVEDRHRNYVVEFFNYAEKEVKRFADSQLRLSRRDSTARAGNTEPDCEVKWQGEWYAARVMRKAGGRWFIHYVEDDHTWDEWVGADRIRFPSQGE